MGVFLNHACIAGLVGTTMLEQNDGWSLTRRYMQQLEGMSALCDTYPKLGCQQWHAEVIAHLSWPAPTDHIVESIEGFRCVRIVYRNEIEFMENE